MDYLNNNFTAWYNKISHLSVLILIIFHLVYEYFRFSLRISHEFCVFDLDQSFLFFFPVNVSCETCDYSATTVKYGIYFLRFSNHDRYFSWSIFKRETWRKVAHLVSEEESVIQKSHPERNVIQKFSSKNLNQ